MFSLLRGISTDSAMQLTGVNFDMWTTLLRGAVHLRFQLSAKVLS